MPIRKLPTLLVNQIAAGEVIERPASVVKELIENSLDAGASRVDIAVEDGGRQLIRISDNGHGIPPGELPLAVEPHATSKIAAPEDLACIGTMGFRGEALASIASVARLRLSSRAVVDGRPLESGHVIEAAGDEGSGPAPVAMAPGTVIEVRDLFFNTPARRKFMRSPGSEFGHISEVVTRTAMAHPHVAFKLTHSGRVTLDAPATDDRRRRCLDLLGHDLAEAMLEFASSPDVEQQEPHTRVWGLAGVPSIARATAKFQYLCLNGRPIRDRNLAHAVKEAYRGLVPHDRQPVVVVFIDIDPQAVDVNVHPAKAEVRFRDSGRLHGLILALLRQRLHGADLTPRASLTHLDFRLNIEEKRLGALEDAGGTATAFSAVEKDNAKIATADSFVEYFKRMAPQQQTMVFEQVRAVIQPDEAHGLQSVGLPTDSNSTTPQAPPLRPQSILQVHESYLVTQDEQGLLIVDQHALHERVMFEELRRRVLGEGKSLESQRMLMPAVLSVTPQRLAAVESLAPLFERIGVEIEPIGPNTVAVQAFPTFLFDRRVDPVEFLTDLLDRAESGELDTTSARSRQQAEHLHEDVLHKILDMMACKAAVKAGDKLSEAELAALLAKRQEIERASNCPHGRPTTIRLSLRDLEKQFKRV